jgi:hypothetical protein
MIEPYSDSTIATEIRDSIEDQRASLDESRALVRPLKSATRRIQPRGTTSIAIVGADADNSPITFDPFAVHIIRVVDSVKHEYCLEVVTPSSDLDRLMSRHFRPDGSGATPLGRMMVYLGVRTLHDLSSMIAAPPKPLKPSWLQVYQELHEWAVLFDMLQSGTFATDTLLIRDGWLRTKVFAPHLFEKYRRSLEDAIVTIYRQTKRRVYLAGVLRKSKFLQKYQLAMMLEGVLRTAYPCYVRVPESLQKHFFLWSEIVSGPRSAGGVADAANMVAGEMFFVKFGSRAHDHIWVVDLLSSQADQASTTLAYMLRDAQEGFPQPLFPMSLQLAREHAEITDLDIQFLQDHVSAAIRQMLRDQWPLVDECELLEEDSRPG